MSHREQSKNYRSDYKIEERPVSLLRVSFSFRNHQRRRTILSKTVARPRCRTTADHYRQTEKLLRCHANHLRQRDSQCGTIWQQPSRSLASADPPTGTANAPIQIRQAGATVSLTPRCRPESVPSGPPLTEIEQSPALAIAILRSLAGRDRGLSHSTRTQSFQVTNLPNASS